MKVEKVKRKDKIAKKHKAKRLLSLISESVKTFQTDIFHVQSKKIKVEIFFFCFGRIENQLKNKQKVEYFAILSACFFLVHFHSKSTLNVATPR